LLRAAAPQQLAGGTLQLAGRSLVVLAGAFLVRAVTEAGAVPAGAGIALGLAYAVVWIVLADRATGAGNHASAAFHGLASAAIAFPLLFEATARFKFLSPAASAVALAGILALALFVAWRRDLSRLAWVFAIGAAATAMALAAATKTLLPFVSFLLGLGLVTLWLGYLRGWRALGWTIAVAVDGAVALVILGGLMGSAIIGVFAQGGPHMVGIHLLALIGFVLSGVFDKYPGLKIILGHLGESLPFSLWRIDMALQRPGNARTPFRDTFREHFWITTSGNFSTPALMCCIMEMGVDRILFSVDYPFVPNPPGTKWMADLPLSLEDRTKILSGNVKRLLKM